jgi:hypothetical protein
VTVTYTTNTVQAINTTWKSDPTTIGLAPTLSNACHTGASVGDSFPNTGHEFIYITNGVSSGALIVTINDQSACDHGFDHDVVANIGPSLGRMLGPFPVEWFTGTALITYSGDVTGSPKISVFQLPYPFSPMPE